MTARGDTPDAALVQRTFDLFNARDAEGIVALMDPAGELYPYAIEDRRHGGYHGHDGLRQYLADVQGMFARFELDIRDVRDMGDGVVFAEGRIRGETKDGMRIETEAAWLWTVTDGRLTRMEAHPVTARREER